MALRIVPGSANLPLAAATAAALGLEATSSELERFPDGEIRPVVGDVRGDDAYVIQPTGPGAGDLLVELLLLLDATRRAGARRITAVVPYLGYARQDRRGRDGEALGVKVALSAIAGAGAGRIVALDPHTTALEAMADVPVEVLSALGVLADALAPALEPGAVVVAPDLGAAKLAERLAARLGLGVAVVRKHRVTHSQVLARELAGDVAGHQAVIVDDMISTGATIEAAVQLLAARGARGTAAVAATHGLLVASAAKRLRGLGVDSIVVTDSLLPATGDDEPNITRRSIAPLLASAIGRLHREEPLADLLAAT